MINAVIAILDRLDQTSLRAKKAEEENKRLRENQKRLLSALRSLYDGQVYHPKESDFYTWNRAMDFADIVLRDLEVDDE
jgi:aspartate/methionine/tyrosine aminotransferase